MVVAPVRLERELLGEVAGVERSEEEEGGDQVWENVERWDEAQTREGRSQGL